MNEEQKEKILNILEQSKLGVIATNSDSGIPESALVGVSHTSELEIVIGSMNHTRKNQNMKKDPKVSLVIGWDNSITLQIEGTAYFVTPEERILLEEIHCQKSPMYGKFKDNTNQEYIKIKPTWIRYSDFSVNPKEVWEVKTSFLQN
jgi:general stress protein 26